MRPLLYEIEFHFGIAFAVIAATLVWSVIALRRAGPVTWGDALRRGFESLLTFGSKGSTEKTDISVPGSLGTVALALGAYGLVRQPVHLPIFGYAAMAFCGFTVTAMAGWKTGPKLGVPPETAIRVAFLCAFFGIVGARIFYVGQFWDREFASQPARVTFGKLYPAKGDTLQVTTERGSRTVTFEGDEKSPSQVVARLAPLLAAGVRAKPIQHNRRQTEVLELIERGVVLETEARGPEAKLVVSGTVLREKLETTGYTPPFLDMFAIWKGGLVYYGGMLFGTAAVFFFVRMQGQRIAQIGDLASSVGAIGIAFGRVGCFLNGCCWGRRIELPWSIRFPIGSPAWLQHVTTLLGADYDQFIGGRQVTGEHAVHPEVVKALMSAGQGADQLCQASFALHPVQVYAILLDVGMFLVLFPFVLFKVKREWQTFFLWFIMYAVVRFVIEHFRGDHEHFVPMLGYPLTPSQGYAVLTLPFSIAGFIWASKRGRPIVPWTPPAVAAPPSKT